MIKDFVPVFNIIKDITRNPWISSLFLPNFFNWCNSVNNTSYHLIKFEPGFINILQAINLRPINLRQTVKKSFNAVPLQGPDSDSFVLANLPFCDFPGAINKEMVTKTSTNSTKLTNVATSVTKNMIYNGSRGRCDTSGCINKLFHIKHIYYIYILLVDRICPTLSYGVLFSVTELI